MNYCRRPLKCLNKIRHNCIFEQGSHCTLGFQTGGKHRLARMGIAYKYPSESFFQIIQITGHTECCHYFRSSSDIESCLPGYSLCRTSQTNDNIPECAFIHVHYSLPLDCSGIEPQIAFLQLDIVIYHGRKKVMSLLNCRQIPCKMKIDIFHGYNLGVASAGSSALHAKNRTK